MKPKVIIHNTISLDGRMDFVHRDEGLYYMTAERINAQALLSGSETILSAYPIAATDASDEPQALPEKAPDTARLLLVVVDSRGRLINLHRLRRNPHWRDIIVLISHATPPEFIAYLHKHGIAFIQSGQEKVDLNQALEVLSARFGVQTIRVDSGGTLNGVLLRAGLVDEISLLIQPELIGGTSPRSMFVAPDLTSQAGVISLKQIHSEKFRGRVLWMRYVIIKK
jgi:2,5-diamino-6-(ribosylamino)-4(3H)-pyrimidinone 5'-phosphate reductase